MKPLFVFIFGVLIGTEIFFIYSVNKQDREKEEICLIKMRECEDYINSGADCDFSFLRWCILRT